MAIIIILINNKILCNHQPTSDDNEYGNHNGNNKILYSLIYKLIYTLQAHHNHHQTIEVDHYL